MSSRRSGTRALPFLEVAPNVLREESEEGDSRKHVGDGDLEEEKWYRSQIRVIAFLQLGVSKEQFIRVSEM